MRELGNEEYSIDYPLGPKVPQGQGPVIKSRGRLARTRAQDPQNQCFPPISCAAQAPARLKIHPSSMPLAGDFIFSLKRSAHSNAPS